MSDDANVDAYFERIGFAGSIAPTLTTLEQLHALHPAAIPFENLDPLMGTPVRLDLRNLEQKLLIEKRGGYCLEQNLLFKAMLENLGYSVTGLAARVLWNHEPGEQERPLSHMVLLVEVNGSDYLADVGFGSVTLTAPLRLRADVEQQTPHETFRLTKRDDDWQLDVLIGDTWRAVYSFDLSAQGDEDYTAMNDRVSADPTFVDNVIAARAEKDRRITLRNLDFKVHPVGGDTEGQVLADATAVKEMLAGAFGIQLPSGERLDTALARVLGAGPA